MIQITQLHQEEHKFDVCVVGGGMAGMCAANAAARNGARVAIVHDRPVFGGNASSEVRMWICGAHGKGNKETGILEEIQLENQYRNTGLNYSIWGLDRDRDGEDHAYAGAIGQSVEYRWPASVAIEGVRLVFDSNLAHEKRMPCSYPQGGNKPQTPASLVKSFRIEAQDEDGTWRVVHQETENYQRLLMIPLSVRAVALRLVPEARWGATQARVFAFEPMSSFAAKIPTIPDGPHFQTVRAAFSVEDLAPPQTSGPEGEPDFAPAA